jgi:hypothetical protein
MILLNPRLFFKQVRALHYENFSFFNLFYFNIQPSNRKLNLVRNYKILSHIFTRVTVPLRRIKEYFIVQVKGPMFDPNENE